MARALSASPQPVHFNQPKTNSISSGNTDGLVVRRCLVNKATTQLALLLLSIPAAFGLALTASLHMNSDASLVAAYFLLARGLRKSIAF